jgi:hypothetical protein
LIVRRFADSDAEGNRENLLRMIALKERMPELIKRRDLNRLVPCTNKSPQGWSVILIPSCTNFLQHGRIDDPFSERID